MNEAPGSGDLQLYIPRADDGWFYVQMLSDPATMAYNSPWFPPDGCIPQPEKEWASLRENWIGREPERFYAFLRRVGDGAFVGDVNYHLCEDTGRYEIGIVIYAPERGKGYGRRGLELLLEKAFAADGVPKLNNGFELTRTAALNIHKSAGFRETGRENGAVSLEITRAEYLASRKAQ